MGGRAPFATGRTGAAAVIVAACLSGGGPARARDILDVLLDDYRAYGLPFPPEDAPLVRRKRSGGVVNGVQRYRYTIAFAVEKADGTTEHWVGCEPDPSGNSGEVEPVTPQPGVLVGSAVSDGATYDHRFRIYADLAFAVQCHARGWDDLARALLDRSNRRRPRSVFEHTPRRPRDERDALALVAWNYWCNRFEEPDAEGRAVFERLRAVSSGGHGLDTPLHLNILADMEKTLAPAKTTAPPGSPEALVEKLVGLREFVPRGGGCSGPHHNATYLELREMGLDAVPALIEHIDDFRIVRSIRSMGDGRYVWHVRVADVVAELLDGLYGREEGFSYDFLEGQGRGKRLDRRHVLHWWNATQGTKARAYLRERAITRGREDKPEVNESVIAALGRQYPNEPIALVEAKLDEFEYVHDLLEATAGSAATEEQKNRVYLRAASDAHWRKRTVGIRRLLEAGHPDAVALLIREIARIPETPPEAYWVCAAGRVAVIARYTEHAGAWAALTERAKRVDVGQRLEMMQAVNRSTTPHNPRVLEFLSAFLDDEAVRVIPKDRFEMRGGKDLLERPFTGPCAGFTFDRLVVGDFAALQIAYVLKLDVNADANWGSAEWRALRLKVVKELEAREK